MKQTLKITLTFCLMSALIGCQSVPKTVNTDALAKTANNTVNGTVSALDSGTKRISDIDNTRVRSITKAPAIPNASNPVSDQNIKDAALSPLEDLNIRRRDIPTLLTQIDDPYSPIADQSCTGYAVSIAELDAVLGVDYDHPDVDLSSSEKFNDRAKDVTLAGVNAGAGLFIPGRGIIKEATGAGPRERYNRALYQRGVARRGFLKGSAQSKGCKIG